ncbi:P-type conjugative transfer protein TrbL [Mesorhizobium sp.]|uniref:P-type conjugative transfer protein TrbL n=1 Tax=Mesorhizobium sp. TaxID=1871066 RepID=UPI000FE7DC00|nr:P-type conjugative transfer protein TrbL [Mesorhizobium sp.]RWI04233.1 MAG: P-type conjugative transfer protein TrbL [Mesorhizobium sp.]RWL18048.1 MAG: P-type conjugative transfer protein TrbL [Mesorhizobium sp.]TIP41328.1 MAG: P-type conjugative transfer protein TrbL [Mesorhizobium sp.]TIP70742.1 MAG: P-type conjugative transfer protein TrbL [Mesorhizobium sp.]TIQ19707.1 MAG: P-type conjugative transfer protein TrbL [Mesorhizobium sp.]
MVIVRRSRALETAFIVIAIVLLASAPALAQQGSVLTTLENQVVTAAKGWETTVMNAARSLFWILAGIEVGIAAVWLAINAASLDAWFAELVRRVMFIGLFAFILDRGPAFAKAVVDSLFQIGAGGGSASPANIFDAGIRVASKMSEQAQFGLFEDNALAIAAVFAMVVVVVSFSLVAAIFVAVMVEMYVGLLAGMIMLGLGGSSYTKDFAVRYLVYAFSVGMKLMALIMIAKIGSDILLGLAEAPTATSDQFITTLAIAGISVVVFVIAMYVPPIMQGVVQGASIAGGMEAIRHGAQAATFAAGGAFLGASAASRGAQTASDARAGGSSMAGAALRGMASGIGSAGWAAGSAAKEKAIASPGAYAGSLLGLANAKLDQRRQSGGRTSSRPVPPIDDSK